MNLLNNPEKRKWMIVVTIFIAIICNYLDRQLLSILKPTIKAAFEMNDDGYAFIVNIFLICYAVMYPISGILVDRFGPKKVMFLGILAWSAACIGGGLSTNMEQFAFFRGLLGLAEPTIFAGQIVATLVRLGMPDARFEAAVVDCGALTEGGRDRVEFRFSANRTTPPAAVERIASGGELSRVMLALKALLARRMQLPTILFDEIDTGVSGRIADAMGEIICTLAETMQVVDITHLPQVASKGSTHFVVYKRDGETHIARLTPDERTTEIAKMLSGSEVTEAAMTQARILLGGK